MNLHSLHSGGMAMIAGSEVPPWHQAVPGNTVVAVIIPPAE